MDNDRLKQIDDAVAKVVSDLKSINPNIEITSGRSPKFYYYTASVVKSKIVVQKHDRNIYMKDMASKIIKDKFLTADDAKAAIAKVMPKAHEKYSSCLAAYRELVKNMGFSIGYNYDGDTYGIYNEYDYISFDLDGFHFQFEIER